MKKAPARKKAPVRKKTPTRKEVSLRKQIAKAQENAKKIISKKNASNKEYTALIMDLLLIITIMMNVFLEKKTRKTPSNSGLPPSTGFGSNGNRNNDNGEGGKPNSGSRLDNSKTEVQNETLSPDKCSNCDEDLDDAKTTGTEQRISIDIIYTIVKTIFTAETKECPECQAKTKADFPEGINGKVQYGDGVKAAIINFTTVQMMSLQRIQEYFMGLMGRRISPAVMLKYIVQFSEFLKKNWEISVKAVLQKAPVLYLDETSMRVNGKNYWIHTCSFGDTVLQIIHPKRGIEGINDMGILDKYGGGTIVHDCWASYFSFEGVLHGLCMAHLMRELKFIEDSTGDRWATRMKRLLKVLVTMVNSRVEKILTPPERKKLRRLYKEILAEALVELSSPPEITGSRGKPKHTDAQNLWLRLFEHEDSVLRFTEIPEVDPTNNEAERNLRMTKVKKKVSGCFRTYHMAQHFCRVYSYIKTMKNKGYSPHQAIDLALKGKIPS